MPDKNRDIFRCATYSKKISKLPFLLNFCSKFFPSSSIFIFILRNMKYKQNFRSCSCLSFSSTILQIPYSWRQRCSSKNALVICSDVNRRQSLRHCFLWLGLVKTLLFQKSLGWGWKKFRLSPEFFGSNRKKFENIRNFQKKRIFWLVQLSACRMDFWVFQVLCRCFW